MSFGPRLSKNGKKKTAKHRHPCPPLLSVNVTSYFKTLPTCLSHNDELQT